MAKYRLVKKEDGLSVLTVWAGGPRIVTSRHPKFDEVVAAARVGRTDLIPDLIDTGKAIERSLRKITRRFTRTPRGGFAYKGVDLPQPLLDHLGEMVRSGDGNYLAFARAIERIAQNPSENARESLYRWMQNGDLSFDARGYLVAYKGLNLDGTSIHAGRAVVNGQPVEGHIPNDVGSVVTMPRDEVDPDTNVACSYGLHIGTYGYASSFGSMLALVAVDPADIVSVPLDCDSTKIRACGYEVVAHLDKPEPIGSTFYGDPLPDDEANWERGDEEDWDTDDDWVWGSDDEGSEEGE